MILNTYIHTCIRKQKKSLISVRNERIHQKSFGDKPHRLDPGLTTVGGVEAQGAGGTGATNMGASEEEEAKQDAGTNISDHIILA